MTEPEIKLHETVMIPCAKLKRDPNNPNVMNERQMNGLRASLKRFGYLQPLIIDKNTMVIADGEHRLTAYEETGRTEVPCILLDLKDDADRGIELKDRVHPTQKPVGLLAQIISDHTEKDDIVLDPFAGSGCLAMEIDPFYCDIILERYEKFTGRKAELV